MNSLYLPCLLPSLQEIDENFQENEGGKGGLSLVLSYAMSNFVAIMHNMKNVLINVMKDFLMSERIISIQVSRKLFPISNVSNERLSDSITTGQRPISLLAMETNYWMATASTKSISSSSDDGARVLM